MFGTSYRLEAPGDVECLPKCLYPRILYSIEADNNGLGAPHPFFGRPSGSAEAGDGFPSTRTLRNDARVVRMKAWQTQRQSDNESSGKDSGGR